LDIELVTDHDRLLAVVSGWEALADAESHPRAGGSLVAGWARHMMGSSLTLHIWVVTDGPKVVGVLPFVAEPLVGGRLRMLPPATDLMLGSVPIVETAREEEIAGLLADAFAASSRPIGLASFFWLPKSSPWTRAFGERLGTEEWVMTNMATYSSPYTRIADGIEVWFSQRSRNFRREAGRRRRRLEDQGFWVRTTTDPSEIRAGLPRLQGLYRSRQGARAGEGYRFDEDMVEAVAMAVDVAVPGRFRLSLVEGPDKVIGASLALRAGTRLSGWLTGFDSEWARFAPGISAILESLDAGARAGCEVADFGVGDQPYKDGMQDASFSLESVTWCRPRFARLLRADVPAATDQGMEEDEQRAAHDGDFA
jgi:CelD/BcsL family acetyltransferase involved in cellulose biosynthesis